MNTYRIEIIIGEKVVFNEDSLPENKIIETLTKYIQDKELFPSAIYSDSVKCGGSACWCGTKNFGYKIARNTDDGKYIQHYFS